jgi:hypothetical protein
MLICHQDINPRFVKKNKSKPNDEVKVITFSSRYFQQILIKKGYRDENMLQEN